MNLDTFLSITNIFSKLTGITTDGTITGKGIICGTIGIIGTVTTDGEIMAGGGEEIISYVPKYPDCSQAGIWNPQQSHFIVTT